MRRLKEDAHGAINVADVNEERFDWHWVKMAFKAPQTWLSSLIWFFLLIPLYVRPPQQSLDSVLLIPRKSAPAATSILRIKTELLPLSPNHHHWPRIYQDYDRSTFYRTSKLGSLRYRPLDITTFRQDQSQGTDHGCW
jgi:hypothetical protein